MDSYYLKRNPNNTWTAKVKSTNVVASLSDERLESFVSNSKTGSLDEVSEFLIGCGVEDGEIDIAIKAMDENLDNVAHFGWYGSFIHTDFEGEAQ